MSGSRNPNLGVIAGNVAADVTGEQWQRNLGQSKIHLGLPRNVDWWTGKPPEQCQGYSSSGRLHSLEMPNLATCTRQQVRDYFDNTWTLTEVLFSSLIGDEPFYRPPYHALRHPLIFYFVHPAVLYVNKLQLAGLRTGSVNSYFERLFETGVDEMSWDDMSKNVIEWPTIDEAHHYRAQVYAVVKNLIDTHGDLEDNHEPFLQDHPLWALFMAFEHERIHLETSSVLIRELPVHLVSQPAQWPEPAPISSEKTSFPPQQGVDFPANNFAVVPAKSVTFGKPFDWPSYGWDNEYGTRSARLSEFSATRFLISNGEFWQFVNDGGYVNQDHWSETGWRWRSFRNVKCPTFWVPDGPIGAHQYRLRTCFDVVPMQWNWPAVVNYHEAQAYCAWRSQRDQSRYRLMTEAEHHAMRVASNLDIRDTDHLVVPQPFNVNLRHGSESSVDGFKRVGYPFGDVFGNVWQWCEDHFNPLEGSRVHRYYDDFSTPCYDGQHQMIMGGSFISTGHEATVWARFHFRPHFFQHAGFRLVHVPDGSDGCVVRIGESEDSTNPYETQSVLNEYMTLHFATPDVQMPHSFGPGHATMFPQRCADLVVEWTNKLKLPVGRALDVGCAVGGATFKLAETFSEVIGVDLSEQFINTAKHLRDAGELKFKCKIEGELFDEHTAIVSKEAAQRVVFRHADACSLPPEFLDFDAVLLANLLCRLPSPSACLGRMSGDRGIVKPGGLLVIVSPYTWMERFTPRDIWPGGFTDANGEQCLSEDGLKAMLSDSFDLLEKRDVPLVIREHRRKYQYIVSQALVWRRRI